MATKKGQLITRNVTWEGLTRVTEERLKHGALSGTDEASCKEDAEFSKCKSLDMALDMLRAGWHEGTGRLIGGMDAYKTQEREIRPDMPLDYAGVFPCVPAFVAGEDQCMFSIEEDVRASRSITLVFPLSYHCEVPGKAAEEYARNVAGIVAGLEAAGIGVGVLGIDSTTGRFGSAAHAVCGVWVRSFDAPLDLARIAFSMHPAMLRRILFAYRERDAELIAGGMASCGYGSPHAVTEKDVEAVMGYVGEYIILPNLQDIYQQSQKDQQRIMRETVEKAAFKEGAQS